MVYLYAALGVVMMTGIMAVIEMGLSLSGRELFVEKPDDPYWEKVGANKINPVAKRDRQMLNLLNDQDDLNAIGRSLQGSELCDQLLCRSSAGGAAGCSTASGSVPGNVLAVDAEERLPELAELTLVGVSQPAEDGFLSNACALQVGKHRLLIQPDPAPVDPKIPYRLFSCYLADSSACEIESNG